MNTQVIREKIISLKDSLSNHQWLITVILVALTVISMIFYPARQETDKEKATRLATELRIANYDIQREVYTGMAKNEIHRIDECMNKLSLAKGQDSSPVPCVGKENITGTGTETTISVPKRPVVLSALSPDELFYTTKISDKCSISQTERQHFRENGRLATDVACGGRNVRLFAPDYNNQVKEYDAEVTGFPDTGKTLILRFEDNGTKYFWLIGHIDVDDRLTDGKVKTGERIGWMNMSGVSTGLHSHIELWQGNTLDDGVKVSYSSSTRALTNMRQNKMPSHKEGEKFFFTHYDLGDVSQNDKAPCIGASGKNLCDLQKKGIETIALTKDIQESFGINYGDKIELDGPCSGVYQVEDTMNSRYTYGCVIRDGVCIKGDISKNCSGAHSIKKV